MGFVERFKKDKRFRLNTILIFVAIVLMAGNVPGDKKEAELIRTPQDDCNQANQDSGLECDFIQSFQAILKGDICIGSTDAGATPNQGQVDLCVGLKCVVGRQPEEGLFINYPDTYGCFECVPIGLRATKQEDCCSTKATFQPYNNGYDYLCISSGDPKDPNKPDTSSQCTKNYQRSFASILDSFEWTRGMGCISQFYLVAFGSGLIAFTIIMAAM